MHNQKFTIKGAKQYLKNKTREEVLPLSAEDPKVLKLIDTLDVKTLKNIQKHQIGSIDKKQHPIEC